MSPLFYAWIKWCALAYRLDPDQRQKLESGRGGRAKLYGISLYTPRVSTAQFPQPFQPPTLNTSAPTPYLSQLPCGGGAFAFFGDAWHELRRYAALRMTWASPPMPVPKESRHDTSVSGESTGESTGEGNEESSSDGSEGSELRDQSDDAFDEAASYVMTVGVFSRDGTPSRTNGRTWKWLFMLELAASRNYFLVYPNFRGGASLSTSHLEERRANAAATTTTTTSDANKEGATSLFRVPLLHGGASVLLAGLPRGRLPDVLDLPQLDVFNDRIERSSGDILNSGSDVDLEDGSGDIDESVDGASSTSPEQSSGQAVVMWRAVLSDENGGRAPQQTSSGCRTASSNAADLILITVKLYSGKTSSNSNCQNFTQERSAMVAEAEAADPILAANLDREPEEALDGGASSELIVRRVLGRVLQQTRLPNWVLLEVPPGTAASSLQAPALHSTVVNAGSKPASLTQATPQAVLELTRGMNCLPRLKMVAAASQSHGSHVSKIQLSYPSLSSSAELPALRETFLTSLQFAATQREGAIGAGAMSVAILPDDAPNELLCRLATASHAAAVGASELESLEAQYNVQHVNFAEKVNLNEAILEPLEHSLRAVCGHHFKHSSFHTPVATLAAAPTDISRRTLHVFVADSGALVPLEVAAKCLGWSEEFR